MSLRAAAPFHLEIPRAALVITDPQVDFLSAHGAAWGMVGKSVDEHDTVPEHRAAAQGGQAGRHGGRDLAALLLSQ